MPLKLAVLGATGPTGLQIVEQALSRGHEVVAIVRTPERLGELRDRPGVSVKVVADISNNSGDQLAEAFAGSQAVLSALGARGSMFSRVDLMTLTVPIVTAAMRKAGVNRLVVVTSQFTVYHADHPKIIEWVIKPLFLKRNLDDFWRAECHLNEQCADLNFTVVKPPQLIDQPLDKREIRAVEGQFVPGATGGVPRANVAQFVLDCAENAEMWPRKLVAIQF